MTKLLKIWQKGNLQQSSHSSCSGGRNGSSHCNDSNTNTTTTTTTSTSPRTMSTLTITTSCTITSTVVTTTCTAALFFRSRMF